MEASMEFRPCIDLHNGQVKQIVGSSLADQNDEAVENFVAAADAAHYAKLYQEKGLKGGHIILLNPESSPYYEQTKAQAVSALAQRKNIVSQVSPQSSATAYRVIPG